VDGGAPSTLEVHYRSWSCTVVDGGAPSWMEVHYRSWRCTSRVKATVAEAGHPSVPTAGRLGRRQREICRFSGNFDGTGFDDVTSGSRRVTGCVTSGRRWHRRTPALFTDSARPKVDRRGFVSNRDSAWLSFHFHNPDASSNLVARGTHCRVKVHHRRWRCTIDAGGALSLWEVHYPVWEVHHRCGRCTIAVGGALSLWEAHYRCGRCTIAVGSALSLCGRRTIAVWEAHYRYGRCTIAMGGPPETAAPQDLTHRAC